MTLKLNRTTYTRVSTIGELSIDGTFECYTLEDAVRVKIVDKLTAIPAGTYGVAITMSPRFKQLMPLLQNVPGYEGIRIHWGNNSTHTEGCLLVGQSKAKDFIGSSRLAYAALYKKLKDEQDKKIPITIEIVDGAVSPFAEDIKEEPVMLSGSSLEVTADTLRLREQPGTSGKIITQLSRGQIAKVSGTPSVVGWIHISTEVAGKTLTGFVSTKYVKLVASTNVSPEFVATASRPNLHEPSFPELVVRQVHSHVADMHSFRLG